MNDDVSSFSGPNNRLFVEEVVTARLPTACLDDVIAVVVSCEPDDSISLIDESGNEASPEHARRSCDKHLYGYSYTRCEEIRPG